MNAIEGVFDEDGGADFAYALEIDGKPWRFRGERAPADAARGDGARRLSTTTSRPLEGLYLPRFSMSCAKFSQGMILLAGYHRVRESTTIASDVNMVNPELSNTFSRSRTDRASHSTEEKCLINQREIGMDVVNFGIGNAACRPRRSPTSCSWEKCVTRDIRSRHPRAETLLRHPGNSGPFTPRRPPVRSARIPRPFPRNMHSAIRSGAGVQHERDRGPEAAASIKRACSGCRRGNHDVQSDGAQTDPREEQDNKLTDAIRIGATEECRTSP